MAHILTVPSDYHTESIQKIAGVTCYFVRGFNQEGLWFYSENVGNIPANSAAPLSLQQNLSYLARKRGMTEVHNFDRFPKKPEPTPKVPRGSGRRGSRTDSISFRGFNPFAF